MIIAIFILVAQSLLFLVHFFIYRTVVHFFGITQAGQLALTKVVFVVLSLSFFIASILAFRFYGLWVRAIYIPAVVWLGTLFWLFWASVFGRLIETIGKAVLPGKDFSRVGIGLILVALVVSAYGVWNSYQTRVKQVMVSMPNLPKAWQGRRAVLVADTHLGNVRNAGFSKKIAGLISAQKPDIVLVAGDFYDGTPENYRLLSEAFGQISSRFGVYFAPGNHEEFRDNTEMLSEMAKSNIKILNNKMEVVDGLQVVGVSYMATNRAEGEKKILEGLGINPKVASVLINHVPRHIPVAEEAGISLQVSGHTHNGQMFPINLITRLVYGKFYYGLNTSGALQVLTTGGAGTWGPPQRVGTNSEIVVITFE